VLGHQLDRDDHRGGQGGDLNQGTAAWDERDHDRQRDRERLDRRLEPLERVILAPDAERRGTVELALDGPVVERRQPGVNRGQRGHQHDGRDKGDRERGDRAKPQ